MRGSYKHASARSRNTVTGAWWLVSVAAHPVRTLREGKSTGWSEVYRNRTPVLTLVPRPQVRIPSHFFFNIIRRYVCFVPPCFSIICLLGWSGTHRNIRYEVELCPLVRCFEASSCVRPFGCTSATRVLEPAVSSTSHLWGLYPVVKVTTMKLIPMTDLRSFFAVY